MKRANNFTNLYIDRTKACSGPRTPRGTGSNRLTRNSPAGRVRGIISPRTTPTRINGMPSRIMPGYLSSWADALLLRHKARSFIFAKTWDAPSFEFFLGVHGFLRNGGSNSPCGNEPSMAHALHLQSPGDSLENSEADSSQLVEAWFTDT